MHEEITPENVARFIYEQIICPTGDPHDALTEWMDVASGLGRVLANWQRLEPDRPGYEVQTATLIKALFKAQNIMRCLARIA